MPKLLELVDPQRLWNIFWQKAKSKVRVMVKVKCARVCSHVLVLVCLLLWFVHVFVPQDLVQHPVEDVEEEEGQREAGPRHRVNFFGPVDEELPHLLRAFASSACGAARWVLGAPRGCGCRDRVVDQGLGVLAVAGGGGHGDGGGLTAVVHLTFLQKTKGGGGQQMVVCYFSRR